MKFFYFNYIPGAGAMSMSCFQNKNVWALIHIHIIMILFAILPVNIVHAQDMGARLVDALGFDPDNESQVTEYELTAWSDNAGGDIFISPDLAADNNTLHGSIILTTGPVGDAGLGTDNDTSDFAGDNSSDVVCFSITLAAPEDAKSLVFTSQFITSEYSETQARKNDNATLTFNGQSGQTQTIILGEAAASSGRTSPSKTWGLSVSAGQEIRLVFTVRDASDGFYDSALRVLQMYFSQQEVEGDYTDDPAPRDTKLPTGSYSFSRELINVPGIKLPFNFSIYYNSRREDTGSPMGRRWSHSYDWFVQSLANDTVLKVKRGDGGADYFNVSNPGSSHPTFTPRFPGTYSDLDSEWGSVLLGENIFAHYYYFIYTTPEQLRYMFRIAGPIVPWFYSFPLRDSFDRGNLILVQVSDPHGNALRFHYNESVRSPRVESVTDTRGNTAAFTYDADGRLAQVSYNNAELVSTFTHNSSGDLTSFTDAAGSTTTFTYDDEGRLLTGMDGNGIVFVDNIYAGEMLVEQRGEARPPDEGPLTSYLYIGDTHFQIDPLGNVYENTYNIDDLLIRQLDPLGAEFRFAYDENNEIARQEDPLGAVSTMSYDGNGNLLNRTDALGLSVTMTYDSLNNMTSYVDQLGYATYMAYESGTRNLISQSDPCGNVLTYGYWNGLVSDVTDARGNTTQYRYNATGDLTALTNPLGHNTQYTYDSLGRKTSVTDPNGNTESYTYDAMGRMLTKTTPFGHTTSYAYDAEGRLLRETAPDGGVTSFGYSPAGQSVSITDPLGNTIQAAYDGADRRVSKTDRLGYKTEYDYDAAGHLTGVTDPAGIRTSASYDLSGNRLSIVDPNGNTTAYRYDALGRLVVVADPLGNQSTAEYDMRGNRASFTNARGQMITYTYDAANRLTGIGMPAGAIEHTLDANGNPVASTGADNGTVTRTFDALNRMVSRTDPYGNTIRYRYDPAGNLTELTYSDNKTVVYTYDDLNRMTQVVDWDGRTTTYFYDPFSAGRLLRINRPDGSNVHYYYDEAGRLIGISDLAPDGSIIYSGRYELNAAGQCISESVDRRLETTFTGGETGLSYDEAHQLVSVGGDTLEYDADGNLIRGSIGGDAVDLTYDAANQLTGVGDDRYEYDASGVRIQKSTDEKTVRYVYDTSEDLTRLLEEHDAAGNIVARYVYGHGLVSREGAENSLSVYHFDRRGNTVALTGSSGIVTDLYAYGPYGKVTGRVGNTPNPFMFSGHYGVMDDGNGLYFMRSRYYAPYLMRFIHKDRLYRGTLLDPQTLNPYAYGNGDPINGVDPNGDFIVSLIIGAVVGAVIGIGIELAVDYFEDGEFDHSFGDYMGAMFTGLVTGAIGGPAWGSSLKVAMAIGAVGGALGSVAGNALGQGIDIATGVQSDFNFLDMGLQGAIGCVFGAAGGAMGYGVKKGFQSVAKKMKAIAKIFKRSGRAAARGSVRVAAKTGSQALRNTGTFLKEIIKHSTKGGVRIGMTMAGRHLPEPEAVFAGVAGFFMVEFALLY